MRGPLDDYLDVLTGRGEGNGWIELRFRHTAGMRTRFYRVRQDRRALTRCVLRLGARRDVYLGCALRMQQRGDRAHVGQAWTLWAECDGPEAGERLTAFDLVPSLQIASGTPGHVHAYWALAEPIAPEALEDTNRRIAAAVGGDPVCFDAARILRPLSVARRTWHCVCPARSLADASADEAATDDVSQR